MEHLRFSADAFACSTCSFGSELLSFCPGILAKKAILAHRTYDPNLCF